MFQSLFRKKSNKLIESAIVFVTFIAFSAAFANLKGMPIFLNQGVSYDNASGEPPISAELKSAFNAAEKTLSKDEEVINYIADHKLADINDSISYGKSARDLLSRIDDLRHDLRPHVLEVEKEISEIDASLSEKSLSIGLSSNNEHLGQHVIPLSEGLLGEYGPTGYHNGIFVSEEKDRFGYLPLTLGVSPQEVPKIQKEFDRLRAGNQYSLGVELAHASFLHNFYRYCKKFDSSVSCLHPDLSKVQQVDEWYASVRKTVALLKGKKKKLISLQNIALKLDLVKERLSQKLAELAKI